jgi:hypothetical protein
MSQAALRTTLLLLVAALVFEPTASFGRGRSGGGGARAAGGTGGNRGALANPGKKKKRSGTLAGAGSVSNLSGIGLKDQAPNFTANSQNLSGAMERFPGAQSKLQTGAASDKLQSFQQQAGQKWQSRDGQFQQDAQTKFQDFKNGPQPFSAQWYADHPAAWQYTHPHADAWAVASAAGVAAWLGWANYADNAAGTTYYNNTVVYEQPPADESGDAGTTTAADEESTNQAANTGDWLELGKYAVLSDSGEPSSRFLQLSVNRSGELRGVYYDSITNTSQNLAGRIDQTTQIAQWSPESSSQTHFSASLNDLTSPSGTIQVTQPNGKHQWRITREETAG